MAELTNQLGVAPDFARGKRMLEENDGAGNTFKATAKPVLIGTAVVGATTLIFSIILMLVGTVTDDGSAPELEGHVRTTLRLSAGMPVFDESARLLGYARTAVWDHEKTLLVTPAQVEAARTATRAVAKSPAPQAPPWWTGPKEPRLRDAGP